jgi:endogenous inhibitor of DNA gyrase (YacG/DUF329 family)
VTVGVLKRLTKRTDVLKYLMPNEVENSASMQTKLPINIQLRLCLNCGHPLLVPVSSRKVFCSPRCRNTFHHRLYRQQKRLNDPEWAARSLQRLKEWREAHGFDKSIKRKGGEAT